MELYNIKEINKRTGVQGKQYLHKTLREEYGSKEGNFSYEKIKDPNGFLYTITYTTIDNQPINIDNWETTIVEEHTFKDGVGKIRVMIGDSSLWETFENQRTLKSIIIPDGIDDIIDSFFKNCSNLEEIVFSKKLTELPYETCSGCTRLKKVTLSENVKVLSNYVFKNCSSLTSLDISGVTRIYSGAFDGCRKLAKIRFSKDLVDIQDSLSDLPRFKYLSAYYIGEVNYPVILVSGSLTLPTDILPETFYIGPSFTMTVLSDKILEIPESVRIFRGKIPSNTKYLKFNEGNIEFDPSDSYFSSSLRLQGSLNIPSTLTDFNTNELRYLDSNLTISVSENNPCYDSRNNCNAIIETGDNILILGCSNTVIPSTVKELGNNCFAQSNFGTFSVPEGVTKIGSNAFGGVKIDTLELPSTLEELKNGNSITWNTFGVNNCTVICKAVEPPTCSINPFNSSTIKNSYIKHIYVPQESVAAYKAATGWSIYSSVIEGVVFESEEEEDL